MTQPNEETFDILRVIQPRLWLETPVDTGMLALEVTGGPYKGVVFSYSKFEVIPRQSPAGFAPVKFETTIHIIPGTCHVAPVSDRMTCERGTKNCDVHHPEWAPDEAFDRFSTEVLFKWLSYINMNNFGPLIQAETNGTIQ